MANQRNTSGRRTVQRLPKGRNASINRTDLNQLIDLLNERGEVLNRVIREQVIQFQRIAQMQADLDLLKRAQSRTPDHRQFPRRPAGSPMRRKTD